MLYAWCPESPRG